MFSAQEYSYPWEELSVKLNSLFEAARQNNCLNMIKEFQNIVPEFQPDKSVETVLLIWLFALVMIAVGVLGEVFK